MNAWKEAQRLSSKRLWFLNLGVLVVQVTHDDDEPGAPYHFTTRTAAGQSIQTGSAETLEIAQASAEAVTEGILRTALRMLHPEEVAN